MEKPSQEKTLTALGEGYRYKLFWSPNSKALAFIDQTMTVYIYDMDNDKTIKVDQQMWLYEGGLQNFSVSWSSDSRYIAYTKDLESSSTAVAIFDTKDQKIHQITSGYYKDSNPVFDPAGKYLYFLTNRSFKPVYGDFEGTWTYPN